MHAFLPPSDAESRLSSTIVPDKVVLSDFSTSGATQASRTVLGALRPSGTAIETLGQDGCPCSGLKQAWVAVGGERDIAMAGRTIARDPKFLVKVYEVFAILFGLVVLAYVLSLGMSPN